MHLRIDPSVVRMVPAEVARKYRVIPVNKTDMTLTIAMADPCMVGAEDEIAFITGYSVKAAVASEIEVALAIDEYYGRPQ
jgi:type IV pilus assembly protein PilB